MNGWARAVWIDVRASYWFIPSLLTLAAIALYFVTITVDQNGGSDWLNDMDWFDPVYPEGARAQLTAIASTMITIASTVFAITIAAVVYASGNYGPRLLTNFMNDRGNQISLGVFIATFVYNLLLLRAVRSPEPFSDPVDSTVRTAAGFVPQLSLVVSGASVLLAVAVLVYFLHHIPSGIRINSVIGQIGRRLVHDIRKRFPNGSEGPVPQRLKPGRVIAADRPGYIEVINFEGLGDLAERHGLVISLKARTGDFIHPPVELVEVSADKLSPRVENEIRGCFHLGDSRTPTQDLEFLIDELVEIGLRALSPGVNDPFTAITSIHWLAAAMAELARRDLSHGPEQKDYDPQRVRPVPDTFAHYLRRSFGGLRFGAAGSPLAALSFLDALENIAAATDSADRKQAIALEGRMLVEQAATRLDGPSVEEIRARLAACDLN